ncbi:hypothetical protein ABK040_002117 [Willaertia magna]
MDDSIIIDTVIKEDEISNCSFSQTKNSVWNHPQNEAIDERLIIVKNPKSSLPNNTNDIYWTEYLIPRCELHYSPFPVYTLIIRFKEVNFTDAVIHNKDKVSEFTNNSNPAIIEAHEGTVTCSCTCFLLSPYRADYEGKQTLYFATARNNIAPFQKLSPNTNTFPVFYILETMEIQHPNISYSIPVVAVDEEETRTIMDPSVCPDISFLRIYLKTDRMKEVALKFCFDTGYFIPRSFINCTPFLKEEEYYNVALFSYPSTLREKDIDNFSKSLGRTLKEGESNLLANHLYIGEKLLVRSFGSFVDKCSFNNSNVRYVRYKVASVPGCSGGPIICFPANDHPSSLKDEYFIAKEDKFILFDGVHKGYYCEGEEIEKGANIATLFEAVKEKYERQVYRKIKKLLSKTAKKQIKEFLGKKQGGKHCTLM